MISIKLHSHGAITIGLKIGVAMAKLIKIVNSKIDIGNTNLDIFYKKFCKIDLFKSSFVIELKKL